MSQKLQRINNDLQQALDNIVPQNVEFTNQANTIQNTLNDMIDKIQHQENMQQYQNDIKTYIHHKLKTVNDTITTQQDTITDLQTSVNCFTRKCLFNWGIFFCSGMFVVFSVNNLLQHMYNISQYKTEYVTVVDGQCKFCTSATNSSCVLTIRTVNGIHHEIPVMAYQGSECQQYINSVLNKEIKIMYKDDKIVYPTTRILLGDTIKKVVVLISSLVIFFWMYKKFIL